MKRLRWILLSTVLLTACGPIAGQLMKLSEGVKSFAVTQGSLAALPKGGPLLVYAPFGRTPEAFVICKGETEDQFATALTRAGLFQGESYLERQSGAVTATAAWLRQATGAEIQQKFALRAPPGTILFGTLLKRETTVAPLRGVVVDEAYRLEFFNLATRQSVTVEIAVRELAEKSVTTAVAAVAEAWGMK